MGGASLGGGLLLAGPLQALLAHPSHAQGTGYGPIAPVKDRTTGDEMLALPKGFEYWSLGAEGKPMSRDGNTPDFHDGMAAFQYGSKIHLVRNHEVRKPGKAFGTAGKAYDPRAPGGTTTIIFDQQRPEKLESYPSLTGTSTNCAGGRSPRGTWLSCEETDEGAENGYDRPHGFVFEVPSDGSIAEAKPLPALGRFRHEALAVDPATWIVYLTEDHENTSGLYRFLPASPGNLEVGRLQMLAIDGKPKARLFTGQEMHVSLSVAWVDIATPAPDPITKTTRVFRQGEASGGAAFRRLEGAWWSRRDATVYFTATNGGDAQAGQVWALKPGPAEGTAETSDRLTLIYESPGERALYYPDNITVSPGGDLLACEDPYHEQAVHLRGITRDGKVYDFARNIRPGTYKDTKRKQSEGEFAGATFSRDGNWLFVNLQEPGVTVAITGPFEKGPLGRQAGQPDPGYDW